MPNFDPDILIRNISMLMEDSGMTQEQLADILGMSQPNVSKALSRKDGKCFTLDQVVGIAKHFGTSVDKLVGNNSEQAVKTGPRGVAAFIASVIESHDAKYTTVEIEEEVYEVKQLYNVFNGYENSSEVCQKKISYPAIYFPDYWKVPTPSSNQDEEAMALRAEAEQIGNDSRMMPVNDFIRKFIQIFEIYESKGLDEEAYRVVVENYLSKLRE